MTTYNEYTGSVDDLSDLNVLDFEKITYRGVPIDVDHGFEGLCDAMLRFEDLSGCRKRFSISEFPKVLETIDLWYQDPESVKNSMALHKIFQSIKPQLNCETYSPDQQYIRAKRADGEFVIFKNN